MHLNLKIEEREGVEAGLSPNVKIQNDQNKLKSTRKTEKILKQLCYKKDIT
jgi:hypothetical protein